jgi:hypothetical protein
MGLGGAVEDHVARPEAPTITLFAGRRLKIAASLVAVVAGLWLYSSEITKNIDVQVKQALQQERDKADKLALELTTELAQVKQARQQDRDEADKLVRELTDDLAQVKQARQQDRDEADKLVRELTVELAQVKQARQQDRDEADKLARELTDDLAQVRQAMQQERDKADKLARELTDDLAQVKQAMQQERDKADKLAGELTDDLAQLKQTLQQERDRADKLARELTSDLAQVKQALLRTEMQSKANEELLVQERARNQVLEEQLVARRGDTMPSRSRNATANLLDTPDPTQAPATDKAGTAPLPSNGKPLMPEGDKPATLAVARPTAPEASGNPEVARLLSRASLLLSQGNIGMARTVLDRAAETGSALALFALAETYDPVVLSAWRTFGTQGDAAKARELYAKAFAGGVQEAGDRLNALR